MNLYSKNLTVGLTFLPDQGEVIAHLQCVHCQDQVPPELYSISVGTTQDPTMIGGPPVVMFLALFPKPNSKPVDWTCKCKWARLTIKGEEHEKLIIDPTA